MSKKMDNVRIVTFKEDYKSKTSEEPIYKKGSVHAIHQRTVAQLQNKGAKVEVKMFDEKRAIELAKQARDN